MLILLLISIYIAALSSEQLQCIDQKKIQKCLHVSCALVHTKQLCYVFLSVHEKVWKTNYRYYMRQFKECWTVKNNSAAMT